MGNTIFNQQWGLLLSSGKFAVDIIRALWICNVLESKSGLQTNNNLSKEKRQANIYKRLKGLESMINNDWSVQDKPQHPTENQPQQAADNSNTSTNLNIKQQNKIRKRRATQFQQAE